MRHVNGDVGTVKSNCHARPFFKRNGLKLASRITEMQRFQCVILPREKASISSHNFHYSTLWKDESFSSTSRFLFDLGMRFSFLFSIVVLVLAFGISNTSCTSCFELHEFRDLLQRQAPAANASTSGMPSTNRSSTSRRA